MLEIEYLCLQEIRIMVIQDKFIDNPQRGSEVGNFPADPANPDNRETCHWIQYGLC
jgi:hypothetical protein